MRLIEAVQRYLAWKRNIGYRFERGETTLLAFSKKVGNVELDELQTDHISSYLNSKLVSTITWRLKYWILRRFFEHWSNRGSMSELAMPVVKPFVRQTFVPHIFTKTELRSLLKATNYNEKAIIRIDGPTLRTLILFLYGTGVAVGEATRILQSDLDLQQGFVTIHGRKFNRSRTLPLGRDLLEILRKHVELRSHIKGTSQQLFVTKRCSQINIEMVAKNFKRLRQITGIRRWDGPHCQPRVSDLRFTFAVHRIAKWIEDGVDLNRMLPALAAYMGQVGLGSTERYLFMTPERFRRDLDKLSPMRGKGSWSSDPELMQFLASL